ncbi:FHA domain-containing protein [Aureliella helgolandensis]|nr:FHA domain-containing protein [Aureliella helgolandensis]
MAEWTAFCTLTHLRKLRLIVSMQASYFLKLVSDAASNLPEVEVPSDRAATIGRAPTCTFAFPEDLRISSVHFEIRAEPSGCQLRDLQSTNGLFRNQQRISTATAVEGDEIQAGDSIWRLEVRGNAGYAPPTSAVPLSSWEHAPTPPPIAVTRSRTTSAPARAARLVLTSHEGHSRTFQAGEETTIGRTELAQWVFPDDGQMSSCHMRISLTGDDWQVQDLQSSNGTYVNGVRVTQIALHEGDQILSGQTRFNVGLQLPVATPALPQTPPSTTRPPTVVPPPPHSDFDGSPTSGGPTSDRPAAAAPPLSAPVEIAKMPELTGDAFEAPVDSRSTSYSETSDHVIDGGDTDVQEDEPLETPQPHTETAASPTATPTPSTPAPGVSPTSGSHAVEPEEPLFEAREMGTVLEESEDSSNCGVEIASQSAAPLSQQPLPHGTATLLHRGVAQSEDPVDVGLRLLQTTNGWVVNGNEIEFWHEATQQDTVSADDLGLTPIRAEDASWILQFSALRGTGKAWLLFSSGDVKQVENTLLQLQSAQAANAASLPMLTAAGLAELLASQAADEVEPLFGPIDAILVETHDGSTWEIYGKPAFTSLWDTQ